MATASVTNTFTNGTTADADEVNTNFTDLVNFVNASVLHLDGSKAMTGELDLNSNGIKNLGDYIKTYNDQNADTDDISTSSSWATLLSLTITDPGVPIRVFAQGNVSMWPTGSYGETSEGWLRIVIDGNSSRATRTRFPDGQSNPMMAVGVGRVRSFDPAANFTLTLDAKKENMSGDLRVVEKSLQVLVIPQ